MRRLAVVYDRGALPPVEIHQGLSEFCEPVFAVAISDEARRVAPALRQLGETVQLTHEHSENVRRLAGVDGIVTFSERMVRATSTLANSLGLPYHDPATTMLLTDKFLQRERLHEAGVDTTRCRRLSDHDWVAVGLPAVAKPAHGGGSRHTYLVETVELGEWLATMFPDEDFVAEELLPGRDMAPFGDYVSVESAVVHGQITHLAVTGKFPLSTPFRERGEFWPAPIGCEEQTAVLRLATDALKALGVTRGLTHTDVKLTPHGPRLIEVNGRLGGNVNKLSVQACGVDLVALAGRIALGEPVVPTVLEPDRVHWHYHNLAPLAPCHLVEIAGWREVLAVPGITQYTPYVRPGQPLRDGVMTSPLDLISGQADSYRQLVEQLTTALDRLAFTFEFPRGQETLRAKELAA